MNTNADDPIATGPTGPTGPTAPTAPTAPTDYSRARLLYWSIRRELWENRSIVMGPSIVAVVMLVGFVLGARRLMEATRGLFVLDGAQQAGLLAKPLEGMAVPIVITASLVAFFYCLDALHGERRDRSILFWKSLPVSDAITVLSKALVPLLVVPLVAYVTIVVLQVVVLVVGSALLLANGIDGTMLWFGLPLLRLWGALIYGLVALALWHAPIYAWLLLVSGWAKRSTFLFAVLPPLALCLVEKIAFDTAIVWSLLRDRLFGIAEHGFDFHGAGDAVPAPLALLATPGLWIGLVVAALLLAATVWFRRYRQPL